MSEAIVRALAARNAAGDLDAIPVQEEDQRPFLQRLTDFLKQGAFGEAQPGQRGTWVPSQINAQGKAELAVPGIVQQPAESLQALMTAPLSDIVRSGDRDAIRAAAEASFDVAGALPAAGAALGRVNAGARAKEIGPLYRGSSGKLADADPQREFYWTTPDRKLASSYAEETLPSSTASPRVQEVFARFSNPKTIDAKGESYHSIDTDSLVRLAADSGHDGVVFKNLVDPPTIAGVPQEQLRPSTTVAAIKRGTMFDRWGNQVFSNPDDPTTAAATAALTAQERPKGIRAYHGSPHDFDRFDLSKIGTGEGAQAYGHGLYFAENEGVARSYRDTLGNYDDNVKWKGDQPPTPLQQQLIDRLSGNDATSGDMMTTQKLRSELVRARRYVSDVDDNGNMVPGKGPNARRYQELTDLLDELKRSEQFIEVTPPGRMYEVNINASPEDFLDWDKPLSQQSDKIREAIPQIVRDVTGKDISLKNFGETGYGLMNALNTWTGYDRARGTKALTERGIPGIRYLDQGSRSAGEGSRNYVVFDDALIDILRKYSNAPDPTTAAILALLSAQQGGQQQQ